MDFSKLKVTDWLIAGGAIVFLIAMFLPWYGFDTGIGSVNNSGWSYFLGGILPLLLILAVFVITVLPKLADGVNIPDPIGPLPRAQAALAGAAAAAVIVLLRTIIASDNVGSFDVGVNAERKLGLFVALLAAIAVAAGAVMKYQGKEPDSLGGGGSAQPPTPF